jgi:xanthine dehydrogenase accessory factor
MLVSAAGEALGYVSGGCVEGSVALLAREAIETGRPRLVTFGQGSPYPDVKLVCGARIEILIERVAPEDESWREVLDFAAARIAAERSVDLDSGAGETVPLAQEEIKGPLAGYDPQTRRGWRIYPPALRLVVIGGDPVALATAQLAAAAGMGVALIRPDGPPAPLQPGLWYDRGAPARALAALKLDPWTAVVTTTHDLELDHETLTAALPSKAFYVGALGSRRRLADRLAKLQSAGVDWAMVKRLRAPVGLDIGAQTAWEIAIAILADIISARRSRG